MTSQYNSNYEGTMAFSDTCFQVGATINAERTLTVPGASNISYQALFSYTYNSNVFVAINATPVVPVGGTTGTQPYNEFRPEKRYVKGGDVLHFITPDASAYIGVSLRQIQG